MFFPLLEFWIAEAHSSSKAVQNQASKANLEFQWTSNMKSADSEASIPRQHRDTGGSAVKYKQTELRVVVVREEFRSPKDAEAH